MPFVRLFYKKTANAIAIANIFPVVDRLRQEDLEGEVDLGSIMKHCLKKKSSISKIFLKYILAVLEEELDFKTDEEALLDKPCI